MTRHLLLSALLTLSVACDEASDLERDANKAQDKADEKIVDAKVDADQEIRDAQAEANKKIAGAQADFTTMREDYRHETSLKLVALDQRIADLEARSLRANGAEKSELTAKLQRIQTSRAVFMRDYQDLDRVSGVTWDDTRARLDREWADLSRLVDEV